MKVGKICSRTCVVCDQPKNARTHAHCTHVLEVFSHAHVRPHIARVRARARTHLRNPPFEKYILLCWDLRLVEGDNEETSREYLLWSKAAATDRGSSSRRYVWGNFSPCWVTQESVCTYYEYEYSARWAIWPQKISQNEHSYAYN